MTEFRFEAIGTHWHIEIPDTLALPGRERLLSAIHERIAVFDKDYSRFRADSLVTEMSRHAGTFTLPADAEPMMSLYRRLYELTEGAFTPLIGQALSDAGYDASYSFQTREMKKPPAWEEAMEWHAPTLMVKQPVLLDFGAAGKGYLIDIVGGVIREFGVSSFCVDAGGDILYRNEKGEPLRVGLEHPENREQVIGVATIVNQSICGSAGNRRAWGNFHHTINPHTLTSPREIAAIWTIADTTMLADGLSTALSFVGPQVLSEFVFEYLIIYHDYSIRKSPGFPAELFTS